MTCHTYEVRVRGPLPPEVVDEVGVAEVTEEPAQTVIRTAPSDQAALQGLLQQLGVLGVELLEVRQLTDLDDPDAGQNL
jgi:hypothetical protein